MKRQYKIVATYEHNKEAYRLWSKKDLEDLKSWCERKIEQLNEEIEIKEIIEKEWNFEEDEDEDLDD